MSLQLAWAQSPSYGPDITLANAKKLAATALAKAQKNNWNVAIAIVDNHGALYTTSGWTIRRAQAP